MYWGDAKLDKIETSDINGNGRRIVGTLANTHFFAFVLHGGNIYITDWSNKYVGFSPIEVFSSRTRKRVDCCITLPTGIVSTQFLENLIFITEVNLLQKFGNFESRFLGFTKLGLAWFFY